MKNFKLFSLIAFASLLVLGLSSCEKDDEDDMEEEMMEESDDPTGSFEAMDQRLSQNMVVVESITMSEDGWVVIHADNGNGGPVVPGIISTPKFVEAGTSTDVKVALEQTAEFESGDDIWIMLHTDTGVEGVYEFDGNSGEDGPILDSDGNVVTSPITIMSTSIEVQNQPVMNNTITIDQVNAAVDGWIVVHNEMGGEIELPGIVGKTAVQAGMNNDVVIELDDEVTYNTGQSLFPMLHIDEGPLGEYNFPGVDVPEVFGFSESNIIVTEITVQ
ncbi:DUF7282 domain-containing protein [Halocola ammonii]